MNVLAKSIPISIRLSGKFTKTIEALFCWLHSCSQEVKRWSQNWLLTIQNIALVNLYSKELPLREWDKTPFSRSKCGKDVFRQKISPYSCEMFQIIAYNSILITAYKPILNNGSRLILRLFDIGIFVCSG